MEFAVRPVRQEDAESIVELLNPIIRAGTHTTMDQPVTVEDRIGFIRKFPDRSVYYAAVCTDGRKILGIQDVIPLTTWSHTLRHVGEISTFVPLDAQRRGIGRRLSKATFEGARALGYRKLMATIRADNPDAVAFYRSQGFEIIGTARAHAFANGMSADEILAERIIG
jgi:L-amino acid N-acyltransferase YncA